MDLDYCRKMLRYEGFGIVTDTTPDAFHPRPIGAYITWLSLYNLGRLQENHMKAGVIINMAIESSQEVLKL